MYSISLTQDQEIAQVILQQLGGNKFLAMTGAHNLIAIESGLQLTLRTNQAKAKFMTVKLNSMDTYDVKFSKISKNSLVTVAQESGLYDDMLQDYFTEITGYNTRL